MRIPTQHYCLLVVLLFALVLPSRGFQPASTWHERPVVALASTSPSSAEFPTGVATTTEIPEALTESSPTAAATTTTTIKKPRRHLLSVVQRYHVTLVSLLILAASAWITGHWALAAPAARVRRNILAGSIIFTIGDVGAQGLEYWSRQQRRRLQTSESSSFVLDQQRLTISTLLGALWSGIAVPIVYDGVERLLPGHEGGMGRVLLKMVLSCSFLSTAGNYITMFFRRFVSQVCNLTTEKWRARQTSNTASLPWLAAVRMRWVQCVASCNADFYEVLMDDLKIWPLYDIACYTCIPPFIRPITTSIMSSLWSMYMSIASAAVDTHKEHGQEQHAKEQEQQLTNYGDAVATQE